MAATNFFETRTLHASVKLFGPFFSTTANRSILGSTGGVGIDVNAASGIAVDAATQPLTLNASGGGAITLGGSTAGAVDIDAGTNAITIGASSASAVTVGGGGGAVTLTSNNVSVVGGTINIGGNGTSTILIGGNGSDAITIGAPTNSLAVATHMTPQTSGLNLGASNNRFSSVFADTVNATTLTAVDFSFQNQVLGWSTTLLKDESGTETITGSPMACKVFELDLADVYSDSYFHTVGSTYYYPVKFDDPRTSNAAQQRIGSLSAHAQVFQIFVALVTPMTGALDAATWNIVHAPMSDGAAALTVTGTAANGGNLELLVASTADLTVGDELRLSGFSHAAWNTIGRVTSMVANTSVLMDIAHGGGTNGSGTATFASQLSTFKTDIVGASAVAVAGSDKRFDDTGMSDTTAGSTTTLWGNFPVPSAVDAAADSVFAVKVTTASPSTVGVLRVFVQCMSFGPTTS